jgi:integrase
MAGKARYLLNRDGRYFARMIIPKELRQYFDGKSELRTPLGPDYRSAMKLLPGAVANIQHQIGHADRLTAQSRNTPAAVRYPLLPNQIAFNNYQARIAFDEELRRTDPRYAQIGYIDEQFILDLRRGMAGALTDDQMQKLVGGRIERYRKLGNTSVEFGTQEWRDLAMSMCFSEYESLERVAERDEGDWSGEIKTKFLKEAEHSTPDLEPVSLNKLFKDYIASLKIVGRGREAETRWRPVFDDLIRFAKTDDARKLTKAILMNWRDQRLKTLAPQTVSKVYLASVRTVLEWAVNNDRLDINVAKTVRQQVPKKISNREQGYTTPEATKILKAAITHVAGPKEAPTTTVAKKWVPFLCAFSGARIAEITQLRSQDFRMEAGCLIMRITPEAGTVKTGAYRDVPVHLQLIDLDFEAFIKSKEGPLFYKAGPNKDALRAARTVSDILAKWMHAQKLTVAKVAPSHGWRHRFKTMGREVGVGDRVLDALMGHASTTAGDAYGDVTTATRISAISKLPAYDLSL